MEEVKDNKGTGFAIGALVVGIIAFLMAVIPCIGVIAVVPAAVAVILGIVGLSRGKENNGMLVGGLVIGVIATMISLSQIFVFSKIADHSENWASEVEKTVKEITTDISDEFGKGNISIKISDDSSTVEIKANASRKDLEQKLDELESGSDSATVIIKVKK